MWFKLAGATFTNNLGTMDSISKSYMMDYSGLTGLQASPGSVSYATDSTPDATITFIVKSGYIFKSGSTITASGGASKTYTASADIAAGNSFTMTLTGINNKVTFVGAAELVSGGGGSEGGNDIPVTPPTGDGTETNLTSQFTWTAGGPVMFADGIAFDEEGYTSGTNSNLAYSNYVDISAYDTLTMTIVTRSTNGATGGWAYYTTNDVSGFISDGASANNGNPANGYSADGVATITDIIPDGAKYIRVTYWSSASTYSSTPFSCIGNSSSGSNSGSSSTSGTDLTSQFTFSPGVLGYEWGWASTSSSTSECPSPSSYPGYNSSLTYSNFVNIEGYSTLKIVNITRKGGLGGTTGGYAFYTSNDISTTTTAKAAVNYTSSAPTVQPASFIADGSTNRHHVNYGAEGVIEETITVPAGAKYIRITGWGSGSAYQTIPFSCIGYK